MFYSLADFFVFVAVVFLLFRARSLRKKTEQLAQIVALLEQRLERSDARPGPRAESPTAQAREVPLSAAAPLGPQITEPAPAAIGGSTEGEPLPRPGVTRLTTEAEISDRVASGPSVGARLVSWLTVNWFYAVSAVSLSLAGLFLVEYGIEQGLLGPRARIAMGLVFGVVLIIAGEVIRRRSGDGLKAKTAYIPSVFSAAGTVSIFGATVAAHLVYALIGPEVAFAGLVATALLAVVLGWYSGALLAAIGVLGGTAAPFIVGGVSSDQPWPLLYFGVVTFLGLAIDSIRRWAWVSVLSLTLGYLTGWLIFLGEQVWATSLAVYVTALALASVLVPARSFWPDQSGPTLFGAITKPTRPSFPAVLSWGAIAATSLTLVVLATGDGGILRLQDGGPREFWTSMFALCFLGILWVLWSRKAPVLQDQVVAPLVGFAAVIFFQGAGRGAVAFPPADTIEGIPQAAAYPVAVTILVGLAGAYTVVKAWRSLQGGRFAAVWAGLSALVAPGIAILIDLTWAPSVAMGPYYWALHAMALAVGMVLLAERFSRVDLETGRLRMALFVLSALSSVAFALVVVLSASALTVALALTITTAAWLDRRFNLAPMAWFILVGTAINMMRLLALPGLDWATVAPYFDVVLAYGGSIAAVVAATYYARGRSRSAVLAALMASTWVASATFASLFVYRLIDAAVGGDNVGSFWALGIYATIWFGVAVAQFQLASTSFSKVRRALAAFFVLLGVLAMFSAMLLVSPLFQSLHRVAGPILFNTLIPAYLLPALPLLWAYRRGGAAIARYRIFFFGAAGALGVCWLFLEIRHFWRGPYAMRLISGVTQPENISYTIAIVLAGAALFYQALARREGGLRKVGLVVIGIAVAKVFLIDIGNLGGLIRVFSFLLLGLSLAGLAWLNRWARKNETEGEPDASGQDET